MTSGSVSRYWKFCRAFISSVERNPKMFFVRLADLETMLHGHGFAFLQLGQIDDREATFNESFGRWLAANKGRSTAAGWAVAVEELSKDVDIDATELFFDLSGKFFSSLEGSSEN